MHFFIAFRERETSMGERIFDLLSPLHIQTGGQTCNLGVYTARESNPQPFGHGTMLQPTEPPGQDSAPVFKMTSVIFTTPSSEWLPVCQ